MSPPNHLINGVVLGLRLCHFAVLLTSLRRFVALHRFPSSHAPVFLGWHLNGVGPLTPPAVTTTTMRKQGPPVGHRARSTLTTALECVQKTLHPGATLLETQDGWTSTPETRSQACLPRSPPACLTQLRGEADTSLNRSGLFLSLIHI